MRNDTRNLILHAVKWTWIIHTSLVVLLVSAKNFFQWEVNGPGWRIDRFFRLAETPVLWLVDPALQVFPILPPQAVFGRIWVAMTVSEVLLYGFFGGLFYSLFAAGVAFLRARRNGP